MRWTHTTSHASQTLHWISYGWRNVFGCGCVLLLLWGWKVLIVGNGFAMGLRGTTTTILSASGNSRNESLLIDSIILSQQSQLIRKKTYLPLMTFIMKELCITLGDSDIPVLLLAIQRSEWYRISWSLLLLLLILAIRLWRKLIWRERGIIGWLGVTYIGGYPM